MSNPLGMAHFTAGLAALALGAVNVCERKGTPTHRMIGVGYVLAMLIVNVTALCLYRLTGRFGPFHALALVSLAIVIGGIVATLLRRERWLRTHYYCMASSYVGLLAAACAEALARAPIFSAAVNSPIRAIGLGMGIAGLFAALGALILARLEPRVLSSAK
jgi:uncharacterized membrane protein